MLPKKYRLKSALDFARVRSQGRCWPSRILVVCKHPNDVGQARVGFSVSRRIGNAVTRNRVRRMLREVVRPLCDVLAPGWDVVVIARHGIVDLPFGAAEAALANQLSAAQLFCISQGDGPPRGSVA